MQEPSKFEKDIEDLLRGFGDQPPKRPSWLQRFQSHWNRWQFRWRQGLLSLPRPRLQTLLLCSIIIIIVAYFFRFPLPLFARYLGLFGIVLFFATFFLSIRGAGAPSTEVRWRGNMINPKRGGLLDWVWRWLGGQRNSRGR